MNKIEINWRPIKNNKKQLFAGKKNRKISIRLVDFSLILNSLRSMKEQSKLRRTIKEQSIGTNKEFDIWNGRSSHIMFASFYLKIWEIIKTNGRTIREQSIGTNKSMTFVMGEQWKHNGKTIKNTQRTINRYKHMYETRNENDWPCEPIPQNLKNSN